MTTVRMPRGKHWLPKEELITRAPRREVCKLLPKPAREALVAAARTACLATLDATIARVKARYPQFFRKDDV